MSFEKHATVAAFLAENNRTPYENVYQLIAEALYEKLAVYEEQEALENSIPVDPLPMLYKLLNNAAAKGDTNVIDVASKAIQRITF
jgi:hypothetical protein